MRGDTLVGVKLRQVGGQEITDYLVIHSDTRGEPLWEYSRSPEYMHGLDVFAHHSRQLHSEKLFFSFHLFAFF